MPNPKGFLSTELAKLNPPISGSQVVSCVMDPKRFNHRTPSGSVRATECTRPTCICSGRTSALLCQSEDLWVAPMATTDVHELSQGTSNIRGLQPEVLAGIIANLQQMFGVTRQCQLRHTIPTPIMTVVCPRRRHSMQLVTYRHTHASPPPLGAGQVVVPTANLPKPALGHSRITSH